MKNKKCPTCGKKEHNFEIEEALNCIPPKNTLKFGDYVIDEEYKNALYEEFPFYNAEEVVGSFLGHNPHFPSQEEWIENKRFMEAQED